MNSLLFRLPFSINRFFSFYDSSRIVDKDKSRMVFCNWKLRNDALLTVSLRKADNETRKGGKAMLNLKNIGQNLKELRVQSHLSQDDVADKLYVSRQAISNWESGKSL